MKLRALVLLLFSVLWIHAAEPVATKRIALVFDDGPRPTDAEPLLAVLANEHVHVTFALVGDRVNASPATAKSIAAAGHEIANHSQTHAHPRNLDDAALDREVGAAQEAITHAVGQPPRWYWLPYIESDPRLEAVTAKAGLKIYPVTRIVASMDYDPAVPASEIYRRATTDVRDGTVILCHEWRKETREQLPAILAELRHQGCVFLTFTALHDALAERPAASHPVPAAGAH